MNDATRVDQTDDPRCKDLRLSIAMKVGRRQSYESPLSKKVLNSIHRYLSGEFHYPKKLHGTPSSSTVDEMRHDLCIILSNRDYEAFGEIVEGADTSRMVPPSDRDAEAETRPFRKSELQELLEALHEEDDERPELKREVPAGGGR